ncbi:helix-turn-helix domain-containing protein [Methylosinus sp. KRF6]|uniref:helix-turn-helix domain-containing protein n=1 Tax=Methylosinus sp. KRF6 TaxID=2846853 RepID=UPI001C0B4C3F|nr:helix-turn-helix domain-containing protein [Methylosinus sp. KRF6]MBU3890091.1 helix-turn-helix domain-containing protein [Methylosinus sp. KRF6]
METNSQAGWHRADILAAVRKRGANLAAIARSVGLSRQSMYWAMIAPHPRANLAIAEFLGVSASTLWPQWFDGDGKLISKTPLPRPRPRGEPIPRASSASSPRQSAA